MRALHLPEHGLPLRRIAAAALLALLALFAARGRAPAAEGLELFESRIRPVLIQECLECHGPEKQKGGLRLDSRAGWQKGGETGPALVPGKPEESLLLRSIQHREPELKMPEKRPKLDAAVIADFERWIVLGAPDPRESPATGAVPVLPWAELLAARRTWWAFQPVRAGVVPPAGRDAAHAVDAFLDAAMDKGGVRPAGPAGGEVLARRLHFALTGMPPSAEEQRSFLELEGRDGRSEAVRVRSEELAHTPAFAEHWARRWMDLVRYAESHGSEGDPALPGAHHYRDYLIRAFREDVPLDRLIVEHVAGDLLAEPRVSSEGIVESRIGPAHLRMVEHGYRPVDTLDEHMKVLDNQMDVVFKAFQATTLSCARCHDHKFDPVSQRDYTAVRGVFESVRPAPVVASTEAVSGANRKAELRMLKQAVRGALGEVWEQEAADLPEKLRSQASPPSTPGLEPMRVRLGALEREIGRRVWKQIAGSGAPPPVVPYALWTFEDGPNDLLGRVHCELVGAARVEGGSLHLNGRDAYVRSSPLADSLRERSFEAWVTPDSLAQRGGGVLGVERIMPHGFDSLVFGEKTPRKWLAGSEYFRRTQQTEGPDETAAGGALVHLVLVYGGDHSIRLFRNGVPYGAAYQKDSLQEYASGNARVLIGLRHSGAGSGFFQGRIDEARLYDRALSAEEVAASFAAGPLQSGPGTPAARAPQSNDPELERLRAEADRLRADLQRLSGEDEKLAALRKPEPEEHPLHLARKAAAAPPPGGFEKVLTAYAAKMRARIEEDRQFNAVNFPGMTDFGAESAPRWFAAGSDVERVACGDFRVRLKGEAVLSAILPGGWGGSLLLPAAGGIVTSPEFTLQHRFVLARFSSPKGSALRLVPDSYPLGTVGAPSAAVQREVPEWARMNAAYRLGSSVYLECATPEHQSVRGGGAPNDKPGEAAAEGPAFLLEKIVLSESDSLMPKSEHAALEWLLEGLQAHDAEGYLRHFADRVRAAATAWKQGSLREGQRELLQHCIEGRLLSTDASCSPALASATEAYRRAAVALGKPLTVPGVLEHHGRDARLLARGDHKKPGEAVPRGFLEVIHAGAFEGPLSGRSQLAERIVDPANPLTARVMVNRLWHWIFGTGLVPTVDDFGRMGEKPSHPELLDYLAAQMMREGWSARRMILRLVQSEAFARASAPTESARERDPGNVWLSHAPVRRMDAEEIRDSMLWLSGELSSELFGAPVEVNAPRRSVYVRHRRAGLPPIFAAFDAPRPFTTVGRRSLTTVPAQSLLLMNDPLVQKFASGWAHRVGRADATVDAQIGAMFREAFARPVSEAEREAARAMVQQNGLPALAHALLNAKEFIYLR